MLNLDIIIKPSHSKLLHTYCTNAPLSQQLQPIQTKGFTVHDLKCDQKVISGGSRRGSMDPHLEMYFIKLSTIVNCQLMFDPPQTQTLYYCLIIACAVLRVTIGIEIATLYCDSKGGVTNILVQTLFDIPISHHCIWHCMHGLKSSMFIFWY